jgi:RND superfamily putative drug exporter
VSSVLYRMGRSAARHPWRVIGLWAVAAVLIVASSSAFGRELEDSIEVPGLDSQQAIDLLSATGSDQAGVTARVAATPLNAGASFFDSAEARTSLVELQQALAGLPHVVGVTDPGGDLAAGRDVALEAGSVSPDGRVAVVWIQYPVLEDLAPADLANLEDVVGELRPTSALQIEMGGELFFAFDEPETGTGELIGLIAAVIILLLAFGSVIAMGLPIAMAVAGLAIGVSSMSVVTYVFEIPSWAPDIAAMVGLGVGIDYALFLVTRHREFLARGMTVEESVGRAVATAGQAVIFAGGTVVIAILGLAVAGVPFLTAAGIATSLIVLIMVVASVTVLPACLGLAGHRINRLGIHRRGVQPGFHGAVGSGWHRWGRHVSDHAWPYAIGVTALLLALTAPVLGLRLGFPDEGTQHESATQRVAYDLVADGFGPGSNGPLLIAVDTAGDDTVVGPLAAAIQADPGIADVAPPELDADSGVATLVAIPTTAPQDNATVETVERLRTEVFPSVLESSPATAHVGGQTANFADVADRITDRLPTFIVAVIALSFLLLVLVFRSILVPLKAAILNLLSIGAAYGVLVMVFQWGWGKELIGLETTVPIVSFIPMFMFAIYCRAIATL